MQTRTVELSVGLLIIAGVLALMILALKVSGLSNAFTGKSYQVTALFDNVGDLKVRAPVSMAGVKIGQVQNIYLDNKTFKAKVTLAISDTQAQIPDDSSASIFTQGLLGSNYISLTPGFSEAFLKQGSEIEFTHSAIVLENLIGQFLFSVKNNSEKK